jgi:hypothetical protein
MFTYTLVCSSASLTIRLHGGLLLARPDRTQRLLQAQQAAIHFYCDEGVQEVA